MSMLAERRRKTKWVINPTKKPIWTTDSEGIKLGKQLMEKMGWSAGKGLGAKEQGIQEPLKVSYKNDTKGMGFKGNDEDWIEHQDEFNSLLSQLSSSDPSKPAEVEKNEIKSLEEKSKHSRARVHYQKFTRGKDLSRYSETDLACILGINRNKKQKDSVEEKNNPVEEKTDGSYETSFGVTTINSGSILDYFKKKWTIGKSNQNNSSKTLDEGSEETLNNTEECTVAPEHKKSKKRKHDELDGENIEVPEDKTIGTLNEKVENPEVGEEVKKDRQSKKRKLNEFDGENGEVPENETVDESGEVGNVCNSEVGKESKKHKKSKKKKKENIDIESESVSKVYKKEKYDVDSSYRIEENNLDIQVGVENVIGDNNLCIDDKRCDSLQVSGENSKDGDENFTRKRKKDKKKREIREPDTVNENVEPVEGGFDPKIKKKKKKDKDRKEKDDITVCEVSGGNYSDRNNDEHVESESVSNADDKIQTLEVVKDTDLKNAVDLESEKSRKEKRKKEKHKSDQSKLENGEEVIMKCEIEAEKIESKSKKKKKKEKVADESIVENEVGVEIKTESVLEEVEPVVKEKKKKGKHKTEEFKVENEKEQEIETRSKSEETTECKTKEKKKKDKHRSDPSTIENEEEQDTKTISELEEAEPKVKEKKSKKNKLGETKKSKHKTDSEGVNKSDINSESLQETNNTSTIQKESEKLKKAEVDTKLKGDELGKGRKPKPNRNKTEGSNRIHSHKFELFKKKQKETSFLKGFPKKTPNNRLMGLIFGAEFEKFKGANVENLIGYGMQLKTQDKGDG